MIERARAPPRPSARRPASAARSTQDDRQAEGAGGGDLAVGGGAAAVLRDDDLDAMGGEERALVGLGEGAAGEDDLGVGRQVVGRRPARCCARGSGAAGRRGRRRPPGGRWRGRRGAARGRGRRRRRPCRGRGSSGRPGPACQGGRSRTTSGTPAARGGARGRWRRCARAKGWVASTRSVDAVRRGASAARPSAPPKPPVRTGAGGERRGAGAAGERQGDAEAGAGGEARRRASRASPVPPRMRTCMRHLASSAPAAANAKWLAVVGIGEDGVDGLGAAARRHDRGRGGGVRRAAAPGAGGAADPRRGAGLAEPVRRRDGRGGGAARAGGLRAGVGGSVPARRRRRRWRGGSAPDEMAVVPAPSAFSLAAARLGWALQETRDDLAARPAGRG